MRAPDGGNEMKTYYVSGKFRECQHVHRSERAALACVRRNRRALGCPRIEEGDGFYVRVWEG